MERFIQIIYRVGLVLIVGGVAISYVWLGLEFLDAMVVDTQPWDTKATVAMVIVWSGPVLIGYGLYRLLRWILKPTK